MNANRTTKMLTAVVVLQGLIIAGQWAGPVNAAREARAGETALPDPGARQLMMVDELRQANAKLDRLTALLQSGEVQVKVVKAEKE